MVAPRRVVESRCLEVFVGLLVLFLGTRVPLNHQSIAPTHVCTSDAAAGELTRCSDGDNPDLDHPIWWYNDAGERTLERECTPAQLRQCLNVNEIVAEEWCCMQLRDSDAPLFQQQVSTGQLLAYGIVLPLLACLALEVGKAKGATRTIDSDLPSRDTLIGFLYSHVLSGVVMASVKYHVGRPRPNYYAMQIWADHAASLPDDAARQLWRDQSLQSFPSGHSSMSASGCVYVSLVLLELVWHVFTRRNTTLWAKVPVVRTLALIVCLVPTVIGIWVAATRAEDYWHFYSDILAGNILGTASALFSFHYIAPTPVALVDAKTSTCSAADVEANLIGAETRGIEGSESANVP